MEFSDHCPFCSNRDTRVDNSGDGVSFWTVCNVCGATGPAQTSYHMAVVKWSERRKPEAREKPMRSAYDRRKNIIH